MTGPGRHRPDVEPFDLDEAWSLDEAMALLARTAELGLSPESFWRRVGLEPGQTVVDVGAGAGRFAFPAAELVGPSGRVYAVEISPALVEWLGTEARRRVLPQVVPVQNTPASIPLEDNVGDVVLLSNVLHDISEPTVREAVRVLAQDGTLVNLDWKKEDTPEGPPVSIRLAPDEAARRLAAYGVTRSDDWEAGPFHYAMRLRRLGKRGKLGATAHRTAKR